MTPNTNRSKAEISKVGIFLLIQFPSLGPWRPPGFSDLPLALEHHPNTDPHLIIWVEMVKVTLLVYVEIVHWTKTRKKSSSIQKNSKTRIPLQINMYISLCVNIFQTCFWSHLPFFIKNKNLSENCLPLLFSNCKSSFLSNGPQVPWLSIWFLDGTKK